MLKIAVVENDKNGAGRLFAYLDDLQKQIPTPLKIQHFDSSLKFTDVSADKFDIAFINPEMPLLSGIELATRLKKAGSPCVIILYAQTEKYALEGYEVNASGYLLKTDDFEKFANTTLRAIDIATKKRQVSKLIIDTRQDYRVIPTSDIIYIEVDKHDLWVNLSGGTKYRLSGTMKEIEERLKGQPFCRCNNCYLINLDYIESVKGDKVFICGTSLLVSRPRKKLLKDALNNYVK